jgi:hypothetical protein
MPRMLPFRASLGLVCVAECSVLELAGDEASGLIHQSGVDTTLSPVISAVAAASSSIAQRVMLSNLIAGREGSMPARPASR